MKILVVEDEVGIANFIKQGLEEESYTVTASNTGEEGLNLALTGNYDLLLLDWMLPKVSGIEICRQFRIENKHTPIIFLTAKDTVEDTINGLQAGANDYIKKPFHFDEFLERIKVQLRPKTTDQDVFTLGPIKLETGNHMVSKHGVGINLTQKEFALLEYLMRNKNKVCHRKQIIEKVWDIHFEYNTSVIDVYINALRKKLNLSDEENLIQTVRGLGYIASEK